MNNENIKINVTSENGEIIIRTGEALPLKEPRRIIIHGDISAPGIWVKTKEINPKKSFAEVSLEDKSILLTLNADSEYCTKISGSIKSNPELESFAINSDKRFSQSELNQLIKFKKMFIPDKERYFNILEQLANLKGTVVQNFERANDNKGQQKFLFEQSLKDKFDLNFIASIPLTPYSKPSTFNIDINYSITDGDIKFWLESVELKELEFEMINKTINEQVDIIKTIIDTIIYI